ncbi:MAG: hypothetical protein HS117_11075 [Verrucomicrobiaceae bacterium]|jgi:hypothetical protein|nr:hypothetical protein [Verrucomicrobiaceae bacterium]
MKLLKYAIIALVAYGFWDMFGREWANSLEGAAGAAKERLSEVVSTPAKVDFELRYDGRARRFEIRTPADGTRADGITLDMLALHLRSSSSLVPHVQVVYDAAVFATGVEQAEFEDDVRRQVERAKGWASFAPKGRPRSY